MNTTRLWSGLLMTGLALSWGFAGLAWTKSRDAENDRDKAISRARQVSADVEELLAIRASTALSSGIQDTISLLGPLNRALSTAGVPLDSLVSATPEGMPLKISSGSASVNSTRIALERLTLAQLGAFLATWRAQEPRLVASSIELTPMNDPLRPDYIRARILLVAIDGAPHP